MEADAGSMEDSPETLLVFKIQMIWPSWTPIPQGSSSNLTLPWIGRQLSGQPRPLQPLLSFIMALGLQFFLYLNTVSGFLHGSAVENPPANAGDMSCRRWSPACSLSPGDSGPCSPPPCWSGLRPPTGLLPDLSHPSRATLAPPALAGGCSRPRPGPFSGRPEGI